MELSQLKQPFPEKDINWRVQSCGISNGKPWAMVLAYIDSRAVMDRLDDVAGTENWQDEVNSLENGKTFCKLSIKIDNEWVTKTGVAGETNIEAAKGGASDALKRAGVKWGIGRYLYHLDENFADCTTDKKRGNKWHKAKTKNNKYIYWKEPRLPSWALPDNSQSRSKGNKRTNKRSKSNSKGNNHSANKDALNKIRALYQTDKEKVEPVILEYLDIQGYDDISDLKKLDDNKLKDLLNNIKNKLSA